MRKIVGIDLGTTNSCIACVEDGRPKVIEDEKGFNILPSFVAVKEKDKFVVGHGAKSQVILNPYSTICAVKRLIGRKFHSKEVQYAKTRYAYEIVEGKNYDTMIKVEDLLLSPVDVSAIILKCLKEIAEAYLKEEIEDAVISVPAYFTHAQRTATKEAGEKAGLNVLRLINEPTAACLAYGFKKDVKMKVAVLDIGGGTFDISILELGDNVYEVIATGGDSYLGGEDFDFRLVDYLSEKFKKDFGVDPRQDKMSLQRMKDAAERAKCELSFLEKTHILIPRLIPTANFETVLTREELENITADLIEKIIFITEQTLKDANMHPEEIDNVIIVGGQTKMPLIQESIQNLFRKKPLKDVHPDLAISIGAALHGYYLFEEKDRPLLLDVTPFTLGIDSAGDVYSPIIEKNSTVPISVGKTFTTVRDNQERVRIVIRQGEDRVASNNMLLGHFLLDGIPPLPKMEPKIDVIFRIDSSGILRVSAKDRITNRKRDISIKDYFDIAKKSKEEGFIMEEVPLEYEDEEWIEKGEQDTIKEVPAKGRSRLFQFFKGFVGRKGKMVAPGEEVVPAVSEEADRFAVEERSLEPFGVSEKEKEPYGIDEKEIEPYSLQEKVFDPYAIIEKEMSPSIVPERAGKDRVLPAVESPLSGPPPKSFYEDFPKEVPEARRTPRKPARLKIQYKKLGTFITEYTENLSRGGVFIRTDTPLDVGRECIFELTIPDYPETIKLKGVVVWSSKGVEDLSAGQEPGMGIKYIFDEEISRKRIENIIEELKESSVK